MVEAHIHGQEYSADGYRPELVEKANAAFAAYLAWERMTAITFRHTEVYWSASSEHHGFGGTLDAIGIIANQLVLCDWKCANAVYPDHLYQLAAYKLLWEENYPEYPIVGGFNLCRFTREQGISPITFSHHWMKNLRPSWSCGRFMTA